MLETKHSSTEERKTEVWNVDNKWDSAPIDLYSIFAHAVEVNGLITF